METLVSICRMCGPLKLLSLCNIWSLHLYRSQSFFKLLCTNSSGSLFMHFKQVILLALITEKFPSILDIAVVKNQLSNLSFIKLLNVQALFLFTFYDSFRPITHSKNNSWTAIAEDQKHHNGDFFICNALFMWKRSRA